MCRMSPARQLLRETAWCRSVAIGCPFAALVVGVVASGALFSCRPTPRPTPGADEPVVDAVAPSSSAAVSADSAVSPEGPNRVVATQPSSRRDPECGPTPEYTVRAGSNLGLLRASLGEERGEVTLLFEKGRRRRIPERPVPGKPAVVAEHDEHDVTLVVARGKREVRIPLGSESGTFDAEEARCWATPRAVTPNPDLELTRISFTMGGSAGFVVPSARPPPGGPLLGLGRQVLRRWHPAYRDPSRRGPDRCHFRRGDAAHGHPPRRRRWVPVSRLTGGVAAPSKKKSSRSSANQGA